MIADNDIPWYIWFRSIGNDIIQIRDHQNRRSYGLIRNQLRGVSETLASALSKAIVIDLEKRLERKDGCQSLETLLVGVILLHCTERMSWYFRSCGDESFSLDWPLEYSPEHYTRQGESFADLLVMLFKLRHAVPRLITDPADGILKVTDAKDPKMVSWLNSLQLTGTASLRLLIRS